MNLLLHWMPSVVFAAPVTEVDLHPRQLVGQTIVLNIRVRNDSPDTIVFPDLTNRPWMIQFDLRDPSGQRKTVQTTTPETDPGGQWSIGPGKLREVRFEVPGSRGWAAGQARIRLRMDETTIAEHTIDMVVPQKERIDDAANPVDLDASESRTLWTQKHGKSVDVFVEHRGTSSFLTTLKGNPELELSVARSDMNIGRWITWTGENKQIWAMRTDAHGIQETPFALSLPWPSVRKCGRPATNSRHQLVQPICVLNPDGQTSTMTVAIADGQSTPRFRSVSLHEPTEVHTNVNAGGDVDLVVVRASGIDLYTLRSDDPADRPLSSRRLFRGTGHTGIELGMGGDPTQPVVRFRTDTEQHEVPLTGPR